jgi:uncharacterized protein (TIGR02117 family)
LTKARGAWRWTVRALAALMTVLVAYVTAGLVGGMIPANRAWRAPETGVTIWVESNGVHTGIVMPKVAAGVDWRMIARPDHLADPRYGARDHVGFGWGERAFYLETPTWADVKARTVLAAATGSSRTLVHVDHLPRPRAGDDARAIVLRPDEYRRLAAHIATFVVPGGERFRGYGGYDAFYQSSGRYSAVATCNAWTGRALRVAGVRVGAWTPFPGGVMRWF